MDGTIIELKDFIFVESIYQVFYSAFRDSTIKKTEGNMLTKGANDGTLATRALIMGCAPWFIIGDH